MLKQKYFHNTWHYLSQRQRVPWRIWRCKRRHCRRRVSTCSVHLWLTVEGLRLNKGRSPRAPRDGRPARRNDPKIYNITTLHTCTFTHTIPNNTYAFCHIKYRVEASVWRRRLINKRYSNSFNVSVNMFMYFLKYNKIKTPIIIKQIGFSK